MTLQMLRIQGDDEEPAKETESDQWSKKIKAECDVLEATSDVKDRVVGQLYTANKSSNMSSENWLEIHLEVIGDLDNCCFNGGDENLEMCLRKNETSSQ